MRKIEKAMCEAVNSQKNWKCSNTEVRVEKQDTVTIVCVYLHGNRICEVYESCGQTEMTFSLAGRNTTTTRSRLNALGIDVKQKNFRPMWNGGYINPYRWYDTLEV